MTYQVSADIKYLNGILVDLTIPDGHSCSFPTRSAADRHAAFLAQVYAENDFIRSAGGGGKYQVVAAPTVTRLPDDPNAREHHFANR